jgi:hypothetical protein
LSGALASPTCLPGPLVRNGQTGELRRTCEHVRRHRLNGLPPAQQEPGGGEEQRISLLNAESET